MLPRPPFSQARAQELYASEHVHAHVAAEVLILQYAVDTGLATFLEHVYRHITQPPLKPSPYPWLLQAARREAAKFELECRS